MSEIFGTTLGRYILLEQLGEGGMAKVYNAYDSRMERNVAVKIILPSHQYSTVFLERFMLEAKALAQLSHTNIVKVLDYGEDNHQPYIVMDYIGGGTLKEQLSTPVPWQKAAAFLAPVARALDYVHKQKIVHRDVKPSNILIDNNNQPMLSDFGVVKLIEEEEIEVAATGVGIGTPDYMSPEQGTGKEADLRSDIYALGVVFYEMIMGQKPYSADTPMAIVIKHVTNPFPRPSKINKDIPPLVEKVILKAVQKDPQKRYQSMSEFTEALEELARGKKADQRKLKKLTALTKPNLKAIRLTLVLAIFAGLLALGAINWNAIQNSLNPTSIAGVLLPTEAVTTKQQPTPTPTSTNLALLSTPTAAATPQVIGALLPASSTDDSAAQLNSYKSHSGAALIEGDPISSKINLAGNGEIARWGMGGANSVDWSPDGSSILVGTTSGGFIFDAATLDHQYFFDPPDSRGWMETAIYSLDGEKVYASTRFGKTASFNIRQSSITAQTTLDYKKPANERLSSDTNVAVIALTLDSTGRKLAIAHANGAVSIRDLVENRILMNVDQYPTATGLAFSADGRYLYVCSKDNAVTVWDIAVARVTDTLSHSTRISLLEMAKNGSFFLTAGDATSVYYWDATDDRLLHSFNNLGASPSSLAISQDGKMLAFGLENGNIKIFAPPAEGTLGAAQKELVAVAGHSDKVTGLAFSPDGTKLVSISWIDGIRIWDMLSGNEIITRSLSSPAVTDLRFSPNGAYLAVEVARKSVQVWDVYSGQQMYMLEGYLPEGDVFSPKNDLLLIVLEGAYSWDPGQLVVIHSKDGSTVETLPGYKKDWRVFFNSSQSLIIEGSPQSAMIWDTAVWQKINTHGGPNSGCGQFYTPDNRLLAIISDVGIYDKLDNKVSALCGSKPEGVIRQYYSHGKNVSVYTVIDGMIFVENSISINTGWLKTDKNIRDNRDIFKTGSDVKFAYARNFRELIIASLATGRSLLTLPWQNELDYEVALSNRDNLVAIGTKFGSIIIYKVSP